MSFENQANQNTDVTTIYYMGHKVSLMGFLMLIG